MTAVGPRAKARLRRGLRSAGLSRPRVSVLVDPGGGTPEQLDATLDSVRAAGAGALEALVDGGFDDVLAVARSHSDADWRVGLGAQPRGAWVLALEAGERLVPGAVDALLAAAEEDGPDVVVGGGSALVAPADLGRALWSRGLWGSVVGPALAAGRSAAYLRGLASAPTVLTLPDRVLDDPAPRERLFGAMPDPRPQLAGWVAEQRAAATEVGDAQQRDTWAAGVLAEAEPFLVAAERLDTAEWALLQALVAELARRETLAPLPVETRVMAWLAAQDRRAALERLVASRRLESGDLPTAVEDGTVRARFDGLEEEDLPGWCLELAEAETRLAATLVGAAVSPDDADPRLELRVHAWIRSVSTEDPVVTVALVGDGAELPATTTVHADPDVTRRAGSRRHHHDRGDLRCLVPLEGILGDGPWQVRVTLRVDGVERTGLVDRADLGDARGPQPLTDDLALEVESSGGAVTVAVVPRRRPEPPRPLTVTDLAWSPGGLQVSGRATEAAGRLLLAGPQGRCEAPVPGGAFTVVLPLVSDPWGLGSAPLPPGRYRLADAGLDPGLATRLPLVIEGDTHRVVVRRLRSGAVELALAAPLDDEERGPFRQAVLQQRYRSTEAPLDPRLVYFQSYAGQSATDSPLAICEELQRRGADLDLVWGVSDHSCRHPAGTRAVLWRSREWYDVLGRAGHVVTNIELEPWFRRRPGQEVVQTFHGYPSKTMGIVLWRAKAFTDSRIEQQLDRTSRNWSVLLTPSPAMDVHYREQYRYEGRILAEGYPRDDLLVSDRAEAVRAATRARLGIPRDATAVLYAPTWRDDQATNFRAARFETHLDLEAAASALGPGYVLLVRGHRFHARTDAQAAGDHARLLDVTGYPEINDLVLAADAAVLDYSSLRFDFALTGRPMVFLVPDLADYTGGVRGFLYDFEPTAPGPLLDTTEQVVAALRDLDGVAHAHRDAYDRFNATYNYLQDGRAAMRVVDAVWGPAT